MSIFVLSSTEDHHQQAGDHELYNYYSRKMLFLNKLSFTAVAPASDPPRSYSAGDSSSNSSSSSFDTNVVMVLSVLLCALICSLGLNSIIRCALKCSRIMDVVSNDDDDDDHQRRRPAGASTTTTGVHKKAIKSFTVVQFSQELNLPGLDAECIICLSDFAAGDKIRLLPKCNHGFHVKCIDKWLTSHSSCPKCRQCLIQTSHKIAGAALATSAPSTSLLPAPHPLLLNVLVPLHPEPPLRYGI